MKRLLRPFALVLCQAAFFTHTALAGGIITEMTEPMYKSYEAQAIKWRDLIGQDERGFYPAFGGAGVQGGKYIVLFRFQPPNVKPINFYGRHLSVIFDSMSNLVGMLRVKPEWSDMGGVSHKRAAETAVLFIRRYVPALWRFANSQSVRTRELEIKRDDGSSAYIEGALSTFYDNKRNTYFFVMVAPDGSVMAFERDLHGEEVDFGRSEENWLYDFYLQKALEAGQEPKEQGRPEE